jgi:hypothetical protein
VDPQGKATGYDDVFTRLEIATSYYEKIGLGRDYVKKFIR